MILCVTPNAALDRTLIVPGLRLGETFHPTRAYVAAGGKGINVARVVRRLGGEACCLGLLGGHSGQLATELAEQEGLRCAWTITNRETRTCVILVDPDAGQATGIYETGGEASPGDWERLQTDVLRECARATDVCISGSIPEGIPTEALTHLIKDLGARRCRVWVDVSGVALKSALEAKPFAVKVNCGEAGQLLGSEIQDVEGAAAAAQHLRRSGTRLAALTLGASGAVLASADGQWHAQPASIKALSAVGSGDAFLAALVVAFESGMPVSECLRRAVAAGTSNALCVQGGQFSQEQFKAVLERVVCQPI